MAYQQLEHLHRLYDGYMQAFKVQGLDLLLIQDAGKTYLIENRCPHMDVSLDSGTIVPGGQIRCRAHGIEFSLDTGKASGALADTLDCLQRYKLVYQGNTVGIDL